MPTSKTIKTINRALRVGDIPALLDALRPEIREFGYAKAALLTGIPRTSLYKMFRTTGNPSFKNILLIIGILELELTVRPK